MDIRDATKRILANTYTKVDCSHRLILLQDVLEEFPDTRTPGAFVRAVQERYSADDKVAADAIVGWGEAVGEYLAEGEGGERLRELKHHLETLPELVLYVPITLSPASIETIGTWCRAELDPEILLDLKIDREAVGGCLIAWKGVLHDLSLSYFLTQHARERAALIERIAPALPPA